MGFDYARVGGVLMQHWSLPESLRETTMLHVDPTDSLSYSVETALVHLGAMLTEAHLGDGVFNEGALSVDAPVWVSSGLIPEDCATIQDEVEEDIHQVMEVIFPRESLV